MSAQTIIDFLLARIADDEEVAQVVAYQQGEHPQTARDGYQWHDEYDLLYVPPARVLAECEAKRRIVELHRTSTGIWRDNPPFCMMCGETDDPVAYPCPTLRALASVYADHPDYRSEWAL